MRNQYSVTTVKPAGERKINIVTGPGLDAGFLVSVADTANVVSALSAAFESGVRAGFAEGAKSAAATP